MFGDKEGYLYLMSDTETNAIKIGISKTDPRLDRTRQLNSGTKRPGRVECIKTIKTKYYEKIERIFHKNYRKYNIGGEWFRLPQQEITALMLMTPIQAQRIAERSGSEIGTMINFMKLNMVFYENKKDYSDIIQEDNENVIKEQLDEIRTLKEKIRKLEFELTSLKLDKVRKEKPLIQTTRAALSSLPPT